MISSVGFVLLSLDIFFLCVFIPGWIITHERPNLAPIRFRRRVVVLIALISGLPLISVIFWDYLGIPPNLGGWLVTLLFLLANFTPLLQRPLISYVLRGRRTGIVFALSGFVLLTVTEIVVSPSCTLIDIYSKKSSAGALRVTPDACNDQAAPIFAHISDLHITERQSTRDRKAPGNRRLASLLDRLNERKPRFLIISGDITDEGTATQWRLVEQLLLRLDRNIKIFISTGNHDLNYFFGRDPDEHPWTWFGLKPLGGIEAEPRVFRAAEFQSRHLAEVRDSSGDTLRDITCNVPNQFNLDLFQRQINECTISCISDAEGESPGEAKLQMAACPGSCAHDLESIQFHYFHDLSESFPLYYIDELSHTAFISVTTSMAESTEAGRNAIGLTGKDQIRNLGAVLSRLPSGIRYIILVQHHPLLWDGVPPFPTFHLHDFLHPRETLDAFYTSPWFLAVFLHNDIDEGEQIYAMLEDEPARRPGTSALVAFGHRHRRTLGRIGSITFEETPNLATENGKDYGFYLVGAKANVLSVSWCGIDGE